MHTRRRAGAITAVILSLAATALIAVGSVAAHTQTVNPKGSGDPGITDDPISRGWAQAHCRSGAPAVVAGASGGVVAFSPEYTLCPVTAPNPGGQVGGP